MEIKVEELKKYGITLPIGRYSINRVNGYIEIYKHGGDTHGCLLLGVNTKKGMITESKATFSKFMEMLRISNQKWWEIEIL